MSTVPLNDGRSCIKWCEYAALEMASVLTDYGPYKRDCRDGDTALLVKTKAEWYQGLEKLIVDKDWREIIGKNARKDAKSRFDIDYMVDSWLLAYSGKVN